jgi:hypothetical protein
MDLKAMKGNHHHCTRDLLPTEVVRHFLKINEEIVTPFHIRSPTINKDFQKLTYGLHEKWATHLVTTVCSVMVIRIVVQQY